MSDGRSEDAAETEAKLARTREELLRLLKPRHVRTDSGDWESRDAGSADAFPRSRTMRMLTSGRGLGALGAVACGLLISRPAMALRLLRLLPAGTVARMLIHRLTNVTGAGT